MIEEVLKQASAKFPGAKVGEIDKYKGNDFLVTIWPNGNRIDLDNQMYLYKNGSFEPFNPMSDVNGVKEAMQNKVYP